MSNKKGFTLVEVLIATVILVIVITGVVALESGHIKVGTSSKYGIQANGLGQEGLNLVKSISDQTKLGGTAGGGDCPDPGDSTLCPAGVYYLDSNNQLMRCYYKDGAGTLKEEPATAEVCPFDKDGNSTILDVKINGKDFQRLVQISDN